MHDGLQISSVKNPMNLEMLIMRYPLWLFLLVFVIPPFTIGAYFVEKKQVSDSNSATMTTPILTAFHKF